MLTHKLKTYPEPFQATREGARPFEIRKGKFEEGDILILQEFVPCRHCKGRGEDEVGDTCCRKCLGSKGVYTGNELKAEVTYVTNFRQGYNQFVLGLDLIDPMHRNNQQEELGL